MKLKEFASIVDGTIVGTPEMEITGVSSIREAEKGDITFVASAKYAKDLNDCNASCVIVKDPFEGTTITQLIVSNPYYAFAKAIEWFYPSRSFASGISTMALVSDTAVIGKNATISPFACISDDVTVGDNTVVMPGVSIGERTKIGTHCIIHPNVVIREGVTIGDRVIIHAGTVVGSDGFGYVFESGEHYKIPQVGGVIIEDDVEIGSNVSIDRATLGNTLIGRGAKIDNLAQIAHNVKIGEKSLIVAQVALGGSSEIGSFVSIGGQSAVADHTTIESGTMIAGQSGLVGQITKGVYSGSPAIPHKNWLRSQALFARLPELHKKIKELEERLKKLEKGESQ